jgi:hypothetical protein
VPPLEAWQKVFVDNEKFVNQDPHAKVATCIQCHGGVSGTDDMAEAHEGVVTDPSADAGMMAQQCRTCHADIAKAWEEAQASHCSSCHTTCGQCHVSQPTSTGGGLISGHQFKATQAFTRTCTGCHGSRINSEYTGQNEGIPADVHWTQAGMPCFKCHSKTGLRYLAYRGAKTSIEGRAATNLLGGWPLRTSAGSSVNRGKLAGLELLDCFPHRFALTGQVHRDAGRFKHNVAVWPVVVADGRAHILVSSKQTKPRAGRVDIRHRRGRHGFPLQGLDVHDGQIRRVPEARLDFGIETRSGGGHKYFHDILLDDG